MNESGRKIPRGVPEYGRRTERVRHNTCREVLQAARRSHLEPASSCVRMESLVHLHADEGLGPHETVSILVSTDCI